MPFDIDHAIIETLRHIQKATQADSITLIPIIKHTQTSILPAYHTGFEIAVTEQNLLGQVILTLIKN